MTSEIPQPFDPESFENLENNQNFFIPPTEKIGAIRFIDEILERDTFSDEEMFEALVTTICLLTTEEELDPDMPELDPSDLDSKEITTFGKFSEDHLYGFAGFDREAGLERIGQVDMIERSEHVFILIGVVDDEKMIKSSYYELDRDKNGRVITNRSDWITYINDEQDGQDGQDDQIPDLPRWEMPLDEKKQLVTRLKEYLKFDPRTYLMD